MGSESGDEGPGRSVCLAVTCHDPAGAFVRGVESAGSTVAALFDSVVVNATAETAASTVQALVAAFPDLRRRTHGAGTIGIGDARRDALGLALESGTSHIAYSDLDHLLRWATDAPRELAETMGGLAVADLTVIGRSRTAMRREPRRLQATESVVNHAATLVLGLDPSEPWDFMIATRLMSREAARLIVDRCTESSIANDVVWPLLARRHGLRLSYVAVDGMAYRYRDDYELGADSRDADPTEWIRRLEIAATHATAMRPYA